MDWQAFQAIFFGFAFGGIDGSGTTEFEIGMVNLDAGAANQEWSDWFIANLTQVDAIVIYPFDQNSTGQQELLKGALDALVVIPQGFGDLPGRPG